MGFSGAYVVALASPFGNCFDSTDFPGTSAAALTFGTLY